MKNYNNLQIIDGLKNRNNDVLKFVIIQNRPMIVFMVESRNGCRQEAEDILQEALMILIKKADKDELKLTVTFSTYLYAVCDKLWLAGFKAKKSELNRIDVYANDIYGQDSNSMDDEEPTKSRFMHYYNQLSPVCKDIIKFYSSKSRVEESSPDMGLTEKYIRKRKYECKNRLIMLIKENWDKI